MSMDSVFKKSVMPLLLMVAIILSLFSASNRVHATSEVNLALNPSHTGYPQVTASYTCSCDSVWNAVDGVYSFDRWTNYNSPNQTDSFTIDFGSAKAFNQVKLYIYNDSGGVHPPASYTIQYWDGLHWINTTNQTKTPETPDAVIYTGATTPDSILNTDNFDTVTSQKLQVVFTNNGGSRSGLVELEVFLHGSLADETAASTVMTAIEQLPIQAAVTLSDKSAIVAAHTAYDNLTATQKSLVTNLSKLTAAEASIVALEASLTDVAVLSAFSNAAGNTITLKLSSVLDITYSMQANNFQIIANGAQVAVTDAVYDSTDSSGQTIKLTFSSPVLLNETSVALSLQSGALTTSNHKLNNAIHSIPVITFKNLDLSHNNLIGVDDVVQIIGNPALHIDVNQDGIFDREDIISILGQISTHFN